MLVGWGGVTQDGLTVRQTMGQHLTKVVSIPAVALPGPGLSQTTAVRRMQSQVNRCNERKWWEGGGERNGDYTFPEYFKNRRNPFFPLPNLVLFHLLHFSPKLRCKRCVYLTVARCKVELCPRETRAVITQRCSSLS